MLIEHDDDLMPPLSASATFSPCRTYRYALSRTWDAARPPLAVLMLNPSTADAFQLDPTIRRCISRAKGVGYGGLEVRNLFAFRATKPADMLAAADPVGPENDDAIRQVLELTIVAAWGCHGTHAGRDAAVKRLLVGADVRCIARTKGGHPGHPLYLPDALALMPFDVTGGVAC